MTTKNAAVECDFYTFEDENGKPSVALEAALSDVEMSAERALSRLTRPAGFPPPFEDRTALALFMAIQYVRSYAGSSAVDEIADHTAAQIAAGPPRERVLEILREQHERDPTDAEVNAELAKARAVAAPIALEMRRRVDKTLRIRLVFSQTPEAAAILATRDWKLVRFRAPKLLTGDQPLALNGGGLATAPEIYFPIDPLHALVLMLSGQGQSLEEGTTEIADHINAFVADQSVKWIFHRPNHDPLQQIKLRPRGGVFTPFQHGTKFGVILRALTDPVVQGKRRPKK